MATGLSLENLAYAIQADKQRAFTQECFVHQIELAQSHARHTIGGVAWWEQIRCMASRQLMITLVVHPLRLTVQWI